MTKYVGQLCGESPNGLSIQRSMIEADDAWQHRAHDYLTIHNHRSLHRVSRLDGDHLRQKD